MDVSQSTIDEFRRLWELDSRVEVGDDRAGDPIREPLSPYAPASVRS